MQGNLIASLKRSLSKMAAFAAIGGSARTFTCGIPQMSVRSAAAVRCDIAIMRHSIQPAFAGSRALSCRPFLTQNRRSFSAHAAAVRFVVPGQSLRVRQVASDSSAL
jgi:hypothetical protein